MCFQWCLPTWNIFKMAHCIRCLSDLTWLPHVPTWPNHQDAAVKNKSFLVAQWVQVSDSIRDSTTCLSQKFHLGPQVKMNAMGSLSTGGGIPKHLHVFQNWISAHSRALRSQRHTGALVPTPERQTLLTRGFPSSQKPGCLHELISGAWYINFSVPFDWF